MKNGPLYLIKYPAQLIFSLFSQSYFTHKSSKNNTFSAQLLRTLSSENRFRMQQKRIDLNIFLKKLSTPFVKELFLTMKVQVWFAITIKNLTA